MEQLLPMLEIWMKMDLLTLQLVLHLKMKEKEQSDYIMDEQILKILILQFKRI